MRQGSLEIIGWDDLTLSHMSFILISIQYSFYTSGTCVFIRIGKCSSTIGLIMLLMSDLVSTSHFVWHTQQVGWQLKMICFVHLDTGKKGRKSTWHLDKKSVQGYQHDRKEKEKGLKDDRYPHIQSNRMRTGRKWKSEKVTTSTGNKRMQSKARILRLNDVWLEWMDACWHHSHLALKKIA